MKQYVTAGFLTYVAISLIVGLLVDVGEIPGSLYSHAVSCDVYGFMSRSYTHRHVGQICFFL